MVFSSHWKLEESTFVNMDGVCKKKKKNYFHHKIDFQGLVKLFTKV